MTQQAKIGLQALPTEAQSIEVLSTWLVAARPQKQKSLIHMQPHEEFA